MVALTKKSEPKLVRYEAMCSAIDACESLDEAKEIRDKAIALAAYAKQALNRDNERKCCEIRIRAERRAGQLLKETAKNGQRRSGHGNQKAESRQSTPKLADHGISKDQSSDWQKLAEIPKKRFEAELKKPGVLSTQQVLHSVNPPPKEKDPIANVDRNALWLWGTLCDFERQGILKHNPKELLATMTEPMKEQVAKLTPKIVEWLEQIFTKGKHAAN